MPTVTVKGLASTYQVSYPPALVADDARGVVACLEEAGKLPFRSMADGVAAIRLGGVVVDIRGTPFDVLICDSTVGIVPRPA